MDIKLSLEVIFILIGLSISGVATLLMAALTSLGSSRIEEVESEHPHLAEVLYKAKQFRSIAESSLTFIDFVGIVLASVFIGDTALFFSNQLGTAWLATVYSSLITVFLFVFLKSILTGLGDRYTNKLAKVTAVYLSVIVPFVKPIVFIMHWITNRLSVEPQTEEEAREELTDEITAIMDTAIEEGTIDEGEYKIFTNLMQFSEVTVSDVMTPRNVVFSLKAGTKIVEALEAQELQMYSRFPVWDGESLDDVVGYVMTKDILRAAVENKSSKSLREFAREVYFIPENVSLEKALEQFLQRRQHMFVVVDEFGGVEGLLTMEDVLETILGAEIVDEVDKVVDLREFAKQRRDQRIKNTSQD